MIDKSPVKKINYLALGVGAGVSLGVALNQIPLGVALGSAFGVGLTILKNSKK